MRGVCNNGLLIQYVAELFSEKSIFDVGIHIRVVMPNHFPKKRETAFFFGGGVSLVRFYSSFLISALLSLIMSIMIFLKE